MCCAVADTQYEELTCEGTRDEASLSVNASFQTLVSQTDFNSCESDRDSDLGDELADDILGPPVQVQLCHSNAIAEILAPFACNYKANMDDVKLKFRQLKKMIERKQ